MKFTASVHEELIHSIEIDLSEEHLSEMRAANVDTQDRTAMAAWLGENLEPDDSAILDQIGDTTVETVPERAVLGVVAVAEPASAS